MFGVVGTWSIGLLPRWFICLAGLLTAGVCYCCCWCCEVIAAVVLLYGVCSGAAWCPGKVRAKQSKVHQSECLNGLHWASHGRIRLSIVRSYFTMRQILFFPEGES